MNLRLLLVVALCTAAFSAFAAPEGAATADPSEVLVPAHDIARGAVISGADLVAKSMPMMRTSDSLIRNPADAVGQEARRALHEGEFIRASDLKHPTLVTKGSTVTMVFELPGIRLTSAGRALAEGGEGDTIAVLNPTSYRQVQAVITGPGTARVGADLAASAGKVAAAQP